MSESRRELDAVLWTVPLTELPQQPGSALDGALNRNPDLQRHFQGLDSFVAFELPRLDGAGRGFSRGSGATSSMRVSNPLAFKH